MALRVILGLNPVDDDAGERASFPAGDSDGDLGLADLATDAGDEGGHLLGSMTPPSPPPNGMVLDLA